MKVISETKFDIYVFIYVHPLSGQGRGRNIAGKYDLIF